MMLQRDLVLVKRCEKACDIYLRRVSSLTYAPNVYLVYRNGRKDLSAPEFSTLEQAALYVKEVA